MKIFSSGEPIDLSEHMLATYQTLRVVLVIIALAFPWVLWIGGRFVFDHIPLQASMSDYYHASTESIKDRNERKSTGAAPDPLNSGRGVMRNWFAGVLFAIGGLLAVYKGFRPAEDLALNLAALFAVLTALVPNTWEGDGPPWHGIFAVTFFVCIAYVCIFTASATLSLVNEDRRKRLRRVYKTLGWAMVVFPVGAAILTYATGRFIFVAEAGGVYAFAFYWLVKTLEIRQTNADRRAASGELQLAPGKGASDAVRELPVIAAPREPVFDVPKRGDTVRTDSGI
jgi:amino acid transporter